MTGNPPLRAGVIQPLPGVGDMVWLLPALRAVAARAGGPLRLFAKKSAQAAGLFAGEDWCGGVIPLPDHRRGALSFVPHVATLARAIRGEQLDEIYILHHSARYALAARVAGVRRVHAYPRDIARMKINGWAKSLAFLDRAGIAVDERSSRLRPADAAVKAVRARFAAWPEPWFVVAIGASEERRRWPVERFGACAGALAARGGTVFINGSLSEAARVQAVLAACQHQENIVAVADLPFDQFVALASLSAGLLGNDSGPANVAAALGIDALTLCGTSKPAAHSPHLRLIEPEDGGGMNGISVEQVLRLLSI